MSKYLEVDSSLLESNFLVCDTPINDVDPVKTLLFGPNDKISAENVPWKLVTPKPGCCLKTTNCKKSKIFVNICQLDEIPPPKNITDEELLELWQSEDASDFKIPLSLQDPHEELDNSGNPAIVYDVAVNTKFFAKMKKNVLLQSFFIQVALEGIENKFDTTLEKEKYVILKNRKCLGNLRSHRIRIQKEPIKLSKTLIEELSMTEKNLVTSRNAMPELKNTCKKLNFRFFINFNEILVGEFHMPLIDNIREINLCINEDRLILESKRKNQFLDLFVPAKVKSDRAKAYFLNKKKFLYVFMPIVDYII